MTRRLSLALFVLASNALMLVLATRVTPPARAASDLIVYDDALEGGFDDWSWAAHGLTNTNPVYAGTESISVTMGAWQGVWFVSPNPVDTSAYNALQFAIHGGSAGGQTMDVRAGASTTFDANARVSLDTFLPGGPVANAWRVVTIPLSAFNLQNARFSSFALQENSGNAQARFYLDDIRLVAIPFTNTTATIQINPGTGQPFDARLLGSNLPAWIQGNDIFYSATFRARTIASGIKVLRIPGGSWSDEYNWYTCEVTKTSPCDWAARPTDFINFLRATNMQAIYTVNANDTPQQAAALVAFFNSTVTDTTFIGDDVRGSHWYTAGVWAQLRADHGNAAPFKITYWEIGNEVYGGDPNYGGAQCQAYGWEQVWTCDGAAYANSTNVGTNHNYGYLQFRSAMRAVDPSIQVGAVGTLTTTAFNNWSTQVLTSAGATMDFYVIHAYAYDVPPASYDLALAQPELAWQQTRANLNYAFASFANGRNIPVAVTEYNLFSAYPEDTQGWMTRTVNALFLADTLGQMAQKGMVMANQWDLGNGVTNNTDYSLINQDTLARYPSYYVYPLWARFGSQLLAVTSSLRVTDTLSVYAGRIDTTTISLLAINKTNQPLTATIQISGDKTVVTGTADVAKANALGDAALTFNGVANPSDDLSNAPPAPLTKPGNPFTYTFAPYSITLLRMTLAPRIYLPLLTR